MATFGSSDPNRRRATDRDSDHGGADRPVQRKSRRDERLRSMEGAPQAIADEGTRGAGAPLPHLDRIRGSFGQHDVSGIQAYTGGAAADASNRLGAMAYATGNKVAFASAPDLHTAAHEAAHVVQQRAGVSLKGGMGEAGDAHERNADAVADAVVAGRSAEGLLASSSSAQPSATVQRKQKLLSVEEVEYVFSQYVVRIAKSRRLAEDDPAVLQAAREATARQVGPENAANWRTGGGGQNRVSVTISAATTAEEEADISGSDQPRKAGDDNRCEEPNMTPVPGESKAPEAGECADPLMSPVPAFVEPKGLEGYQNACKALRAAVQKVASQVEKLKDEEGLKGAAGRAGVAVVGGAGVLIHRGKKAVEIAKDVVLGGLADVVGGTDRPGGSTDPERQAKRNADDDSGDVAGVVGVVSGRFGRLYKATLPSYTAFLKASNEAAAAHNDFAKLKPAYGRMKTAAQTYYNTVKSLNIAQAVKQYDDADKSTMSGLVTAIEQAVEALGGAILDPAKSALAEGRGPAMEKVIEKATDMPKELAEQALEGSEDSQKQ